MAEHLNCAYCTTHGVPNSLAMDEHWGRMIAWLKAHRLQLVLRGDGEVYLVRAHYNVRGSDQQDTDPQR